MISTPELDKILDALATTTDLSLMESILENQPITVTGTVDITHIFGKVSSYNVSLDNEDEPFYNDVVEAIRTDIEDNELILDDIMVFDIVTDNAHWFLLPIDDGGVSTKAAIMIISDDLFDKDRWEKFSPDTNVQHKDELKSYTPGQVNSLVKMVNAGENATEIVDNFDLAAEAEDEVLSFRGN